ncbi:MAG: ATP-binding protein [Bacilli bacterium]
MKTTNNLFQETLVQMREMRLTSMADELSQIMNDPKQQDISSEELVSRITEAEYRRRTDTTVHALIKKALFQDLTASKEGIDYRPERQLNKASVEQLFTNDYLLNHRNVIIQGATGTGKSYLSQALGIHACENRYHVLYFRLIDLLSDLKELQDKPSKLRKYLYHIKKADLLILDDFLLFPIETIDQKFLYDILDYRLGKTTTLICSQMEDGEWYRKMGATGIGEAIIDRLTSNSFRIVLQGKSMRAK